MNPPAKYIATIAPVREVTLVGTSDPGYWRKHLRGTGFMPCVKDGTTELTVSAIASKWMGLPFRELSFALPVSHQEGAPPDGLYFLAAFNSSRFLAFCERFFFQTPYVAGRLEVQEQPPATFQLRIGTDTLLRVEMAAGGQPLRQGYEVWEGALFLPGKIGAASDKVFYARLEGETAVHAFTARDVVTLVPTAQHPVLQWLTDARFAGREWHLRTAATHARSKTYRYAPEASREWSHAP